MTTSIRKYIKYFLLTVLFIFVIFFILIKPSNRGNWNDSVAVLPYAKVKDNNVTIYNIRNFKYKSEHEYKIQYYNESFDLNKLNGVDLLATYWMGDTIAHIFLSFSFSDGKIVAMSIEIRTEKGENFSTVKGFFKQYELFYVVASENDIIKLRTNYRKNPTEDVYLYKLKSNVKNGQKLFLEYINQINSLKNKPVFYNTLTTNCTTTIWMNSLITDIDLPFSWKILVSGYLPEYLYDNGLIENNGLTFKELRRKSYINERVKNISDNENFSKLIRN